MDFSEEMIAALRSAQRGVVFTGAGVSAESGIPTFRDKQTGLWENFSALDLATPQAFARDPALVWSWYEWRRALILDAVPNAGHAAIVALGQLVPQFALITQNVDDLHERAGSEAVVHLHGEIARPYCEGCGRAFQHDHPAPPAAGSHVHPPQCAACGSKIRPGVVWFGESLPVAAWQEARAAARRCDLFICCGTSAVVQPAASLVDIAIEAGAFTIQINLDPTHLDTSVDATLCGPSGTLLPQLLEAMR